MDIFILEKDIRIFCVTAESFPEGIMAAFHKLHSIIPSNGKRRNFGISRPDSNGKIIYKAAVEESFGGESCISGCEVFIIKSGEYISITVKDFMKNIKQIGESFKELTSHPGIDPDGWCIEIYSNENDVLCMVKLAETIEAKAD